MFNIRTITIDLSNQLAYMCSYIQCTHVFVIHGHTDESSLLYYLAPSSVQNVIVTLIDAEMINVTWLPSVTVTDIVHQYIIKRINSSGTFHYHVSANQQHIVLPYYNDALVFVSAVNLFGVSDFEQAQPSGKPFNFV